MIKKNVAIFSGKTAGKLSRLLGNNGSTLPGVVALKIDPNIIRKLSRHIKHFIFITGTNGKTTTSNLLAHLLRSTGMKILNNSEGANMISGVAACLINNTSILGHIDYDYAVLEIDEASLPVILKQITPQMLIITNFFRDQLDRYGEIDMLIKDIEKAIHPIETKMILNADDPNVFRLSSHNKDNIYYGLGKKAYMFGDYGMSESKYCPMCGEEMLYDHIHFNQLGFFSCSCGFERPIPNYEIDNIQSNPLTFSLKNETYQMNMTGTYNVYNALAAITCAAELGIQDRNIKKSLHNFHLTNGRMQLFFYKGFPYIVNLNKNPSGMNVSLSEILSTHYEKQIVFFINDFIADGRDVSWIWDIDFECLQREDIKRIICSGSRTSDIMLRLKYAGIDPNKVIKIPSIEKAIQDAFSHPMPTYFLPTYTALQEVKNHTERSIKKENESCAL
ncbi:UDP-N-acetylmuramyl tripeptide synthase [Paenibacillus sp. yr247]|uniref:Mur ligase family protein n=1 Tax=Paenibacillus sp. yr247 TaxID=1761880 RepID=UPI0008879C31|nr:Mur ligase family protein [Paenibacillus sp. yr247]SDO12204.1 UDP-N-acetylmuramyl tripeptide synthase [Paenibacillus sp. yr247]